MTFDLGSFQLEIQYMFDFLLLQNLQTLGKIYFSHKLLKSFFQVNILKFPKFHLMCEYDVDHTEKFLDQSPSLLFSIV